MGDADVPSDAPEHCPGTQSDDAGKATPCQGCPNQTVCASGEAKSQGPDPALLDIQDRMNGIKEKILILSGKGGVGKSTFSATLARALAAGSEERQVALLDIDICGPSQPRMMGAENQQVHQSNSGWSPVYVTENLSLMSIGFLLGSKNDAVIWRGPRKNGMIKQFLKDVDWGELDYLLVDTPPGTSDEHMSLVQLMCGATKVRGAILVTTPQEISLLDVRKEANFCKRVGIPVIGVVENMAGFVCSHCHNCTQLFPNTTGKEVGEVVRELVKDTDFIAQDKNMKETLVNLSHLEYAKTERSMTLRNPHIQSGGAEKMCSDMGLPFLGSIPMDPRLATACDEGTDFLATSPDSPAAIAYHAVVAKLLDSTS